MKFIHRYFDNLSPRVSDRWQIILLVLAGFFLLAGIAAFVLGFILLERMPWLFWQAPTLTLMSLFCIRDCDVIEERCKEPPEEEYKAPYFLVFIASDNALRALEAGNAEAARELLIRGQRMAEERILRYHDRYDKSGD